MLRILFLLVVGVAIGYFIGFNDAQKHDQNVVTRHVKTAGGAARSGVVNDLDAKYDKAGK